MTVNISNITSSRDGYNESYEYYGEEDDNSQHNHLKVLLLQPPRIIALVLGFIAVVLNIMSLLALSQVKNRITTHHRLIMSLAMSDMLIGISVVLHFVGTVALPVYKPGRGPAKERLESRCTFLVMRSLNTTGLNISLFNLMAMALDHHVAIIHPLHYASRMRKKNACILIGTMWMTALFLGFSNFLSGFNKYKKYFPLLNYCEAAYMSAYQDEYVVFAITFIACAVLFYIYSHIYYTIRRYRIPGESTRSSSTRSTRASACSNTPPSSSEVCRSKRALATTMLILGTFLLCWMPICIYQLTLVIQLRIDRAVLRRWLQTLFVVDQYILDLLLLNSIADPIIYAVRMYDIQLGYRRLIKRCLPHLQVTVETSNNTKQTRFINTDRITSRKNHTGAEAVDSLVGKHDIEEDYYLPQSSFQAMGVPENIFTHQEG